MRSREHEPAVWKFVLDVTRWWNVTAEQRERAVKKIVKALREIDNARLARDRAAARRVNRV